MVLFDLNFENQVLICGLKLLQLFFEVFGLLGVELVLLFDPLLIGLPDFGDQFVVIHLLIVYQSLVVLIELLKFPVLQFIPVVFAFQLREFYLHVVQCVAHFMDLSLKIADQLV